MSKQLLVIGLVFLTLSQQSCKLFKPFYERKKNNVIRDSSTVLKYKKIQKYGTENNVQTADSIAYIKAKIITVNKYGDTNTEVIRYKDLPDFSLYQRLLTRNKIQFANAGFKAKVKFETKENNQNFTANFRMRNDSLTWCSISAIIGEVARAIVNNDSIKAIDKLGNKALLYSYRDLSSLIDLSLPHATLQELLIGNNLYDSATHKILDAKKDVYGTFKVFTQSPLGNFVYDFNADSTLNAIQLKTAANEKVYNIGIYYSLYQDYQGKYLIPQNRKCIIRHDDKETTVEMDIVKFNLNQESLDFPFAIPKNFKTIFKK